MPRALAAVARRTLDLAVLLSLTGGPLPAATMQWNSLTTGNWNTGANWDSGKPPGSSDRAIIDNGGTVEATTAGAVARRIDLAGNATLVIDGGTLMFGNQNLRIGDGTPGTANQHSGTVDSTSGGDLLIHNQGTYRLFAGTLTVGDDLDNRGLLETSGGTLSVGDDLRLHTDSEWRIVGSATANPTITIDDDLQFDEPATITIELAGNVPPTIQVGDELRLGTNLATLAIQTTHWTGDAQIELFEVAPTGNGISGNFAAVFVNDVPLDSNDYAFDGTSLLIRLPEPASHVFAGTLLILPGFLRRASSSRSGSRTT